MGSAGLSPGISSNRTLRERLLSSNTRARSDSKATGFVRDDFAFSEELVCSEEPEPPSKLSYHFLYSVKALLGRYSGVFLSCCAIREFRKGRQRNSMRLRVMNRRGGIPGARVQSLNENMWGEVLDFSPKSIITTITFPWIDRSGDLSYKWTSMVMDSGNVNVRSSALNY